MENDEHRFPYGCDDTLGDIHKHLVENTLQRTFGPLKAYLTGCEALVPHPYRFWYYSCTHVVGNGRLCGRTASGKKCPHVALPGAGKKKTFKFDVFFSNGCLAENIPPLRAGIFEPAEVFLGITAESISLMSELDRHWYVTDTIARQQWVEVILRCKDGLVTIYDLKLKANSPICMNPSFSSNTPIQQRTMSSNSATSPAASPLVFLTPRSTLLPSTQKIAGNSNPGSSSSARARSGKFQDVRAKLINLMEIIDLSDED